MMLLAGLLLVVSTLADVLPSEYIIPAETVSPSRQYGFRVPLFHDDDSSDDIKNALIAIKRGNVIAEVNAPPGFNRPVNYIEVATPWWSQDEFLVL